VALLAMSVVLVSLAMMEALLLGEGEDNHDGDHHELLVLVLVMLASLVPLMTTEVLLLGEGEGQSDHGIHELLLLLVLSLVSVLVLVLGDEGGMRHHEVLFAAQYREMFTAGQSNPEILSGWG